jgi:hypothetical protein
MRPAGVAIGFIQKQARFIYITVAGAWSASKHNERDWPALTIISITASSNSIMIDPEVINFILK